MGMIYSNYDRLKMITKKICDEKEYIKFLRFCNKFYDEDYKNQLLIYLQHPGATKVNTFSDWKKEGRNVKKNPRKIYLYGYYRKKKEQLLNGQIDIAGKEKNKRKETIECFNGLPYRRTCNYDIADTYLDRNRNVKSRLEFQFCYSEQEFMNCLMQISPTKIVEEKDEKIMGDISICQNLSIHQNISLVIHQMCHYIVEKKLDFENKRLEKFAGETVGFLIANYFGFDTSIYKFTEISEFKELKLETKVDLGTFIQRESKEIINMISERIKNKEQICA